MVTSVNPASIIPFLFHEAVIGADDMQALQTIKDDPQQQCGELMTLLQTSEHPQAFSQLYAAIKNELHRQWLVERIDKFRDQSVIDLLQQRTASDARVIDDNLAAEFLDTVREVLENPALIVSHRPPAAAADKSYNVQKLFAE